MVRPYAGILLFFHTDDHSIARLPPAGSLRLSSDVVRRPLLAGNLPEQETNPRFAHRAPLSWCLVYTSLPSLIPSRSLRSLRWRGLLFLSSGEVRVRENAPEEPWLAEPSCAVAPRPSLWRTDWHPKSREHKEAAGRGGRERAPPGAAKCRVPEVGRAPGGWGCWSGRGWG